VKKKPPLQEDARASASPPLHSITSSARASSVGGTSRPSALAVVSPSARAGLQDIQLARISQRVLRTRQILVGVTPRPAAEDDGPTHQGDGHHDR
jgi:hypothetical protein